MPDVLQRTAVRWTLAIALWSTLLSLGLFGFVYWRTAAFMQAELAHALRHELGYASSEPNAAAGRIETWLGEDLHSVRFAGLFDTDGQRLAGNLDTAPADLPDDGAVRRIGIQVAIAGRRLHEELWSAARTLPDGRTVVVAHDTDEVDRAKATVVHGLGLALLPMLALSILGGALLAGRARRRVAITEDAVARLMRGDLRQRLPVDDSDDAFDRLARDVNALLDEIERLMDEVRGVGDAIAHDLRTPLTRLRARLERSREQARSVEEFREAVDQGLVWIDQTLAMVTAVLRIGEIEHGRRCAGFTTLDLGLTLAETAEFFEPMAEDKGVRLTLSIPAGAHAIRGDRDLIFEALSNLVDNAVKFTPPGGEVSLGLTNEPEIVRVTVADTGPGIREAERSRVFNRFYRSEPARQTVGNGLGLGLVVAIVKLHGATIQLEDAPSAGARFELTFREQR
ncbi:ATP-binding protein [Methylobacterium sp. WL9]|uniref:HAMP domain-containing sensor histidine kinase n=1 Tax=Methylobacterium sp. WL9 TaxID=2603898 RepID=UPI0011CB4F6A|nr:ATP-binding protein [Methylobacterium sp. WL9]TXN22440.1 HAMP domain-containing protein [Methylobacterium sp. WL9]